MNNAPIPDPVGSGPIQQAGTAQPGRSPSRAAGDSEAGSPAFRVLLERLQERARDLEQTSQTIEDPKQLAGAVDDARASLEDALSLSDQLLEAFREARQQSETAPFQKGDSKS